MFFRWKRRQIKQNFKFFQFFEKISFIAGKPYQQILQKYAYWGYFACRIHICNENSSKSYDFHEKCKKKKNRKMNNFGNFC